MKQQMLNRNKNIKNKMPRVETTSLKWELNSREKHTQKIQEKKLTHQMRPPHILYPGPPNNNNYSIHSIPFPLRSARLSYIPNVRQTFWFIFGKLYTKHTDTRRPTKHMIINIHPFTWFALVHSATKKNSVASEHTMIMPSAQTG